MDELRKKFEGNFIVKPHMMVFNEAENKYLPTDECFYSSTSFVNGAWMAFQEQQKKIDKINSINQCAESQLGDACVRWRELSDDKQKKIDDVLKHIEHEEWMDEYGDYQCPVQRIRELLK